MNEKLIVRKDGSVLYKYDLDINGEVGCAFHTFNEVGESFQNTFARLIKCWTDQGYTLETRTSETEVSLVSDYLIREKS